MDKEVLAVQRLYPRIYMACHTDHVKAASSEHHLSARDATILAHLSDEDYTSPSRLAEHLQVTRATMSEALLKLTALEYVTSEIDLDDERKRNIRLTPKGLAALSGSSVLDYSKVKALLERLSAADRMKVIEGLSLLANAAFV